MVTRDAKCSWMVAGCIGPSPDCTALRRWFPFFRLYVPCWLGFYRREPDFAGLLVFGLSYLDRCLALVPASVGPVVRLVGYQQWDMLIVSRTCRRCALSYLLLVGLTFRLAQVRFAVDALVVAVEGPLDLSSLFA